MRASSILRWKLLALLLALILFLAAWTAPALLDAAVPQSGYVRVAAREFAAQVSCSGIVELLGKREVYLSTPVIAQEVLVSPGDRVRQGETLATVDTQLTKSVLSQSITVEREPAAQQLEKLEQAAALYGVSLDELLPVLGTTEPRIGSVEDTEESIAVPRQILAPSDGVVTQVSMASGCLTQTAQAVFTIADADRYAVRTSISESQVEKIAVGDAVTVTTAAAEEREYHGAVIELSPVAQRAADGEQATVEAIIEIFDPDEALRDNYSASAVITSQHARTILSVPYEAVGQDENNVEFVWVYRQGRCVRQPVTTGEELANCVEIVDGLLEDDLVLTDTAKLREGRPVRLGAEGLL